jgi:hypothetical protein
VTIKSTIVIHDNSCFSMYNRIPRSQATLTPMSGI